MTTMPKTKDPQGRKWQLTINNPIEKGFDRARIKSELGKLKSAVYWCMADEKGNEEETPHTHIFIAFSSAVRFSTLKNLFSTAHIERANGTAKENRDYIAKEGKWADTDKAKTNVEGSFEESGEMPQERQGGFNIKATLAFLGHFPVFLKTTTIYISLCLVCISPFTLFGYIISVFFGCAIGTLYMGSRE